MSSKFILTSESVSEGHPDKLADKISDAILDAHLSGDPEARVACEVMVTRNFVCVAGETRSLVQLEEPDIDRIVRDIITDVGYVELDDRFSASTVEIQSRLHTQAAEIAAAVDRPTGPRYQGAGDQGMMFGYATDETQELMPAPIIWAHALTRALAHARKSGLVSWLRPDAKSQVSLRYGEGVPQAVTRIVVSTQHAPDITLPEIKDFVIGHLVPANIPAHFLPPGWEDAVLVNPSGSFILGGPATDTGLTGRKIIVDTYGGAARHGGGAFSGKDPSKVDRSAAYAARWAAKNVVAHGLARRCELCVAYAIGVAEPVALGVECFGTGSLPDAEIAEWVQANHDLTPRGIIDSLDLLRPIYSPTATYGHFGRKPENGTFPWELVTAGAGVGCS